jgi:hypothetical protein
MGRKRKSGYALPDLVRMVAEGKRIELSAIPVADEHEVFFRELGTIFWDKLMAQNKKVPFSYKTAAIAALISRVTAELPSAPLRIYFDGRTFSSAAVDPTTAFLQKSFDALTPKYKGILLQLLNVSADDPDVLFKIELRLTYPEQFVPALDDIGVKMIKTFLALPDNWEF